VDGLVVHKKFTTTRQTGAASFDGMDRELSERFGGRAGRFFSRK
jgi:hypothetical protein